MARPKERVAAGGSTVVGLPTNGDNIRALPLLVSPKGSYGPTNNLLFVASFAASLLLSSGGIAMPAPAHTRRSYGASFNTNLLCYIPVAPTELAAFTTPMLAVGIAYRFVPELLAYFTTFNEDPCNRRRARDKERHS